MPESRSGRSAAPTEISTCREAAPARTNRSPSSPRPRSEATQAAGSEADKAEALRKSGEDADQHPPVEHGIAPRRGDGGCNARNAGYGFMTRKIRVGRGCDG